MIINNCSSTHYMHETRPFLSTPYECLFTFKMAGMLFSLVSEMLEILNTWFKSCVKWNCLLTCKQLLYRFKQFVLCYYFACKNGIISMKLRSKSWKKVSWGSWSSILNLWFSKVSSQNCQLNIDWYCKRTFFKFCGVTIFLEIFFCIIKCFDHLSQPYPSDNSKFC